MIGEFLRKWIMLMVDYVTQGSKLFTSLIFLPLVLFSHFSLTSDFHVEFI